jgi:hypothetical protein
MLRNVFLKLQVFFTFWDSFNLKKLKKHKIKQRNRIC